MQDRIRILGPVVLAALATAVLTACGGGDGDPAPLPEETRLQDARTSFAVLPPQSYPDFEVGANGRPGFTALAGTDTDRWAGTPPAAGTSWSPVRSAASATATSPSPSRWKPSTPWSAGKAVGPDRRATTF